MLRSFHRVTLAVAMICAVSARGTHAQPILLGVNSADDGLSRIDPVTGAVTFIGRLSPDPNTFSTPVSMAVRESDRKVFVWNNSDNGQLTGELLTVNPITGLGTKVNPAAPAQGELGALAINATGVLFGFDQFSLYHIDTLTGLKSLVGSTIPAIYAADFGPDGRLYGIGSFGNILYRIDPATGASTTVGALSVNIGVPGSIVFDPAGKLLGTGLNGPLGRILFDLNPSSGAVSNIRSLSGPAPQGLGFIPEPSTFLLMLPVWWFMRGTKCGRKINAVR